MKKPLDGGLIFLLETPAIGRGTGKIAGEQLINDARVDRSGSRTADHQRFSEVTDQAALPCLRFRVSTAIRNARK